MNNNKYRATAVSYLNTKPFLYGLLKTGLGKQIDLQLNIPSEGAQKLRSRAVDFGLVPVAILPEIPNARVFSDYCIGTTGAVKTVCIYSDRPIEELTHLYLDYHSRTSVALTKILLREYWQLYPQLISARAGYIEGIGGAVGGLVIGDRTIGLEDRHEYVYDLGEIWQTFTGLPFVFAAWVSIQPLPEAFVHRFNHAMKVGLDSIPELMYLMPNQSPHFDLERYFKEFISYDFTEDKRQSLDLFLKKIEEEEMMLV
ncbi:MAG: menaquinone biosynthesis protein [Bacteroidota bacterium]